MSIELEITKPSKVKAAAIHIYCKVRDEFTGTLMDSDGNQIAHQDEGYVPSFMPGEHYGDYLILNIDLETGMVTNWEKPTAAALQEFVEKNTAE